MAQSRGLIQLVKTKQELDAIDIAFLSELVLVDVKCKEYNVRAIFQASQQRSLCELSQGNNWHGPLSRSIFWVINCRHLDGNSLYITSLDVTEELYAKYGELFDPDASVWDVPTLRRLDLATGKVK